MVTLLDSSRCRLTPNQAERLRHRVRGAIFHDRLRAKDDSGQKRHPLIIPLCNEDLNSPTPRWIRLEQIELINNLKSFVFIQLKKRSGFGSVSYEDLWKFGIEDKEEIIEQILIHKPHIIVCGGVGGILSSLLDCKERYVTPKGIGYWIAKAEESKIFLIDYCHPSIRASNKVIPTIAYGLRDACLYLMREEGLII
jgi:hypothetical protein